MPDYVVYYEYPYFCACDLESETIKFIKPLYYKQNNITKSLFELYDEPIEADSEKEIEIYNKVSFILDI
jgi:hypothetical protein